MNVFGVHGDFFPSGTGSTQDFEFNSTPALELATPKTTQEILGLRIAHGLAGPELETQLKKRSDCPLQMARYEVHNTHLEACHFYSQTAFRFGEYVMKFRPLPDTDTLKRFIEETVGPEHDGDILAKWMQSFFKENSAEYLFQVQLPEDADQQLIEDSVEKCQIVGISTLIDLPI